MLFITIGWQAAHQHSDDPFSPLKVTPLPPTLSPHLHSEMLDNLCVMITQIYVMLNSSSENSYPGVGRFSHTVKCTGVWHLQPLTARFV